MSGICGILTLRGQNLSLGPTLELLERRGPDGTHEWAQGKVALGHALLVTTPEALTEILPLTDPSSGCTITADARLDNRETLIDALLLRNETRTIGDGELILRAYVKWGEECPAYLLGDFAFAIWDPRLERLVCARDHMGMRQLIYYHQPGSLFAFATEAEALVAHPLVTKQVNRGRIADFLDGLEGLDRTSTFFKDILRLPPAHVLAVDSRGLSLRRYWTLEPGPELTLATDQEYADAFLKIFTEAVSCRLRSAGAVGSMLSGGLDSNSIGAVAARLLWEAGKGPLRTFSATDPHSADCAETDAIRGAIRSPLLSATLLTPDDLRGTSGAAIEMRQGCAEPFDAYMVIAKTIYGAARRAGVKVMLDGAGADVVLTSGNRVAELFGRGKISQAFKEARQEAQFWGPVWPTRKIVLSGGWAASSPECLRRARRRIGWWLEDRAAQRGHGKLSRAFATAVKLKQRREIFRGHQSRGKPFGQAYRARTILHPHLLVARERYDRVASAFGVEPRDPFMDIRVIQFALSLPPEQLQAGGWPKTILRRATADIVPAQIGWRRGKAHLGWTYTSLLIKQIMAEVVEHPADEGVKQMLGKAALSAIGSRDDMAAWYQYEVLRSWLKRNQ